MITKNYTATEERTILIAMIVHDGVLGRIHQYLAKEKKPFRSRWSNIISRWCLDFYQRYQKAPKKNIEGIFEDYARTTKNNESVDLIDKLLASLNDEYKALAEEINEDYVVDVASKYFQKVKLERTAADINDKLERNDTESALVSIRGFSSVDFATTSWIDPFNEDAIKSVMSKKENRELIVFPSDLGKFLSPHFERDGFIAFAGPEKRGKSFWLLEVAWRAMLQKRKVLHYTIGDMSQDQVQHRFIVRAARRPFHAGTVELPVTLHKDDKQVSVEMASKEFDSRMSTQEIIKKMNRIKMKTASNEPRLKLRCVESDTLCASDIEREVGDIASTGWVPDVLVLDYADLLLPEVETSKQEYRHQINKTWKILRRIAQKYHMLVVTATQTASSSYDAWTIRKKDFSEDKRKNAHVTGMLGINQTADEKEQGIYRLNWIFLREGKWTDNQVVYTAGNLSVACPCIISSFLQTKRKRTDYANSPKKSH